MSSTKLSSAVVVVNPKSRSEFVRDEKNDDDEDSRDNYTPTPERDDSPKRNKSSSPIAAVERTKEKTKKIESTMTRAGGAYIPPAKLRMMQQQISDKSSMEYQRVSWEMLKKKIHGQVNRANIENLQNVIVNLLQENIVRGKGLLARSILQAQAFSPTFSHVYAALVAVINSKFPNVGELILKRLILQFKRSFRTNDKAVTITTTKFIAHLINQNVVHEALVLQLLILLLETPTDDSVEVAIALLKECGAKLTEVTPRGIDGIFNTLRSILHESELDKRIQYAIEVIFSIRKDKFAAHPSVIKELDLVEESDQITHETLLDDQLDPESSLNVFRFDPDFLKNEEMYEEIKADMLGSDSSDEDGDDEEGEEGDEKAPAAQQQTTIVDNTETNLVAFRRTVYLTIQSSLDYQEAIHKLMKMEIKPGMEVELCHMILDCCAQQRTYEKFYGLMAERFCRLRKEYQQNFEQIFKDTYDTIHRFEITKLRNTTKLFAHLLYSDAISWNVLGHIKLNEDDTTSSGRICIKILFQELAEFMGLEKLYERIQDPTMQSAFDGVFPRDNPRDTKFAINFFTSIGLGGLTVDLRQHLTTGPRQQEVVVLPKMPDDKVKQESSDAVLQLEKARPASSSSEDSDSDSSESSDDSRDRKRKRKQKKKERSSRKESKEDKKSSSKSSKHKRRR